MESCLGTVVVRKVYYWPNMYFDVKEFVDQCIVCKLQKPDTNPPKVTPAHRPITELWECVSVDTVGPLPKTATQKTHIIVLSDCCSGYLELLHVSEPTGIKIVQFLRTVFNRWGFPRVLISDNGTEFVNKTVTEYLRSYRIRHELTPTYHPQANPVERINRNLKILIRTFILDKHGKWDLNLPELVYAYNTSVHSSLSVSPAFLSFGRDPGYLDLHRDSKLILTVQESDSRNQVLSLLDELRHYIESFMIKAQNRQDAKQRISNINLQIGAEVYIRNHQLSRKVTGFSGKLAPARKGPYFVREFKSNGLVNIVDVDDVFVGTFSIGDLKIPRRSNRAIVKA